MRGRHSVTSLAKEIGISRTGLSQMINGHASLTAKWRDKIVAAGFEPGLEIPVEPDDGHPGRFLGKQFSNQTDVASRLGVSRHTVTQLFNGHSRCTMHLALLFEREYGIDAEKLLVMQVRCDLAKAR